MVGVKELDPAPIQELMDAGKKTVEIQRELGLRHHSVVSRAVAYFKLEDYKAVDEYDYKYRPEDSISFEWVWEEDQLEIITRELLEGKEVRLDTKFSEMYELSRYVSKTYGTIIRYLVIKGYWMSVDDVTMECRKCRRTKSISDFYTEKDGYGFFGLKRYSCKKCTTERGHKWNKENPDRVRELSAKNVKKYYQMYPERFKQYSIASLAKRRAYDIHLGFDFSVKENEEIFGKSCKLTGECEVAYDHFIPLRWGHAGSYNNNMYPLRSDLNSSKHARNPFDWFEDNHERLGLDRRKFNDLVTKLAELNGLTVEEYTDFVYWCDANRREPEEIEGDPRTSIEIWRESTQGGRYIGR